jgi:hypothetical protein
LAVVSCLDQYGLVSYSADRAFATPIEKKTNMPLDKKQKKQIEVAKKKLVMLRQQLAGAKQQMDDPADVTRLQNEIKAQEEIIQKNKGE